MTGAMPARRRGASRVCGLRTPIVAALAVLMMVEYANAPLAFVPAPATSTASGRWLKAAAPPGAVLYLPLALDRENSVFMVQSLEHKRPIVNGYSGQRPSFFTSFVDAFADPASIEARAILKDAAVRYVVSPAPIASAGDSSSPFVERARVAEGVIYELVWTPESEAALEAAEVAAPPPPGPLPFAAGETATYEAEWLSGPLDIPAGTITLRVLPRRRRARRTHRRWTFEATMDTAGWVARFFEAHDRFRNHRRPAAQAAGAHPGDSRRAARRRSRVRVRSRRAPGAIGQHARRSGQCRRPWRCRCRPARSIR